MHVAVFPQASKAVAVTTVVPTANSLPEGGAKFSVAEQLSVTVAEYVTVAVQAPGAVLADRLPGQTMAGG